MFAERACSLEHLVVLHVNVELALVHELQPVGASCLHGDAGAHVFCHKDSQLLGHVGKQCLGYRGLHPVGLDTATTSVASTQHVT